MLVVALGGNALLKKDQPKSVFTQLKNVKNVIEKIAPLLKERCVITHGNGPQVGNIMIQVEEALGKAYPVPLHMAVAESQGEIGFMIEQAVLNTGGGKPSVSLLTRVLVDNKDPAFSNPTKPIGPFYSKGQASKLKKYTLKKVIGGYRRVVPSPKPVRVLESDVIKRLSTFAVVIAAGGGGIPVIRQGNKYAGVDAVIDKDLASACLATSIGAKELLILTDVECAYINYGKQGQKPIRRMTAKDAKRLLMEGHFPEGSMGPKVQAAVDFIENDGNRVIITSAHKAAASIRGRAGTTVMK